jgi:hypothetical protein
MLYVALSVWRLFSQQCPRAGGVCVWLYMTCYILYNVFNAGICQNLDVRSRGAQQYQSKEIDCQEEGIHRIILSGLVCCSPMLGLVASRY